MKKLTKMNKFEMVMEILVNGEFDNKDLLIEFVQHEMDLLARKNSTGSLRKPTKTQQENEILLEEITDYFNNVATGPHTIAMLQANIESLTDLTNQKVSALLKKLVDNQILVKFVDKKKTFFALPTE